MAFETKLRKVGGSVMLAIPPPLLDELGLAAGASVDLAVKAHRLVLEPRATPRYTLDELLKQTKAAARRPRDPAWTADKRRGRELI